MTRILTATVLAAALAAATLPAAPARASSQTDTAALLIFGAVALYAIIDSNKGSKNKTTVETPTYQNSGSDDWYRHDDGHHHQDRDYSNNKRYSYVLPSRCVRATDGRRYDYRDPRSYISVKCLTKSDYRKPLPRSCRQTFYTEHGRRDGYITGCLIRKGYVIGDIRY